MRIERTRLLLLIAIGSVFAGAVLAGTMEPPGPPGPTMVTLQQIYDKACGLLSVAKTGQVGCWNASGASVPCAGTGQDGALQKGVAVSPRFVDNGNGTVTDNLTGLIWLKNANCWGMRTWSNALSDASGLASGSCGLTDGSTAGMWRLPNVKEAQSLVDYGQRAPALPAGHPFVGVQSTDYWTSTANQDGPVYAWFVGFGYGFVSNATKANFYYVWPVRGGQ